MIKEEEREKIINLVGIAVCLTAIALLMSVGIAQRVSANPYYLNLTTGQFVDLNETNETTLSIAIYNYSYLTITNITWNVTNITNYPCYNCTTNITNITNITNTYTNKSYYLNSTSNETADFYTKAQADNKYLLIGTPYASVGDLNVLINKFNELNHSVNNSISEIEVKKSSNAGPWIISILAFILACAAIYLARRAEGY